MQSPRGSRGGDCEQRASPRPDRDDQPGRGAPEHEQPDRDQGEPEVRAPPDRAGPHGIVERREQETNHRGIDAAQARLKAHAPPQELPERQPAYDQQESGQEQRDERPCRPDPAVGRLVHDRAEIRGEREQRTRYGLRRAIAGDELLRRHPARRNHLGLQQGEHDVPAPEHQRARAVEAVEHGQRVMRRHVPGDRQPDEQREEQRERADGDAPADRDVHGSRRSRLRRRQALPADPAGPATAITSTWETGLGDASTASAARIASDARARSAARFRAMPHTAWATTATATTLSPCSHPTSASPAVRRPYAKTTRAAADGSVNPSHAATPPSSPARISPIAIPTWLLAGPGRNWHSATRSA